MPAVWEIIRLLLGILAVAITTLVTLGVKKLAAKFGVQLSNEHIMLTRSLAEQAIHFADAKNIATFTKTPKKYVSKLGLKLVEVKDKEGKVVRTVLDVQNKNCVVNPKTEALADKIVEQNGVRVRVCCGKCKRWNRKKWH